jgi:hypothetical protein
MDHDQRFKTLIRNFFMEFLQLFFSKWAERLDASAVEWLDKEIFPNPPEGRRRVLDLLGKLPLRQLVAGQRPGEPDQWLALIHIEIESPDKASTLRPRMYESYGWLRHQYGLPVLPIVVFLNVGLEGIGVDVYAEDFWELRAIQFQYLYVGLPTLNAVEYVNGDNWLGVALAALMRIPKDQIAWLGAEALRRIQTAPLNDQQRFLLGECVEAYLPLDDEQKREFERIIASPPYQGVQAVNMTSFEKGIEKGVDKELRSSVREMIEAQFGALAPETVVRLEQLPADRLRTIRKGIFKAKSLHDLGLDL